MNKSEPDIDVADQSVVGRRAERDALIGRLRRDRDWFKRSRAQLQFLWISLTLISLGLGFLTSIFIAMGWPSATDQPGKAILVALPALGSFCGTILAHFRLRENWELRELGRIDVDEAIVRASFLPVDDLAAFSKGLYELQMARVQLSRLQTAQFFATLTEKQVESQPGARVHRTPPL
jgi:hypothetical protein